MKIELWLPVEVAGAGGWYDCYGQPGGAMDGINNGVLGKGSIGINAQSGGGGRRWRILWWRN